MGGGGGGHIHFWKRGDNVKRFSQTNELSKQLFQRP